MRDRLKAEYIKELEKKLNKARSSYEIAKKDTIEAEGRMVTRYDSTKTETAWLADGYLKDVKELENIIEKLQANIKIANFGDTVNVDRYVKNEFLGVEEITLDSVLLKEKPMFFTKLVGLSINDTISEEIDGEYVEYQVREISKKEDLGYIGINSFVVLEDEDGYLDYYYLVNYLGGMEIEVDDKDIFCVSKQTPIVMALLGKIVGEKVKPNPSSDFTCVIKSIL